MTALWALPSARFPKGVARLPFLLRSIHLPKPKPCCPQLPSARPAAPWLQRSSYTFTTTPLRDFKHSVFRRPCDRLPRMFHKRVDLQGGRRATFPKHRRWIERAFDHTKTFGAVGPSSYPRMLHALILGARSNVSTVKLAGQLSDSLLNGQKRLRFQTQSFLGR